MEFEKFNCFFVGFLRYSFGRIKVSTVVKREYTPRSFSESSYHVKTNQLICFAYQLTGLYIIRGFTELYFLTHYGFILENHFYFVMRSTIVLNLLYLEYLCK